MVDTEHQCHPTGHRQGDHMGLLDAKGIEQTDRVRGQVPHRVPRPAGRVRRGSSGVALVVPDHVPTAAGQQSAQALRPPEHGRRSAVDQQHSRVGRIAEGLRAQFDTVDGIGGFHTHDAKWTTAITKSDCFRSR
jgi:hypothetical protein